MYIYIYMYMYTCVYIYIYVGVCMYVCIYIYIYTTYIHLFMHIIGERIWGTAPASPPFPAHPRNPTSYPHPRLQDFPTWKRTLQNTGTLRVAWRQDLGGGDKFWAAGTRSRAPGQPANGAPRMTAAKVCERRVGGYMYRYMYMYMSK